MNWKHLLIALAVVAVLPAAAEEAVEPPVRPATTAATNDQTRDRLEQEIALEALRLKLAELQARRAELEQKAREARGEIPKPAAQIPPVVMTPPPQPVVPPAAPVVPTPPVAAAPAAAAPVAPTKPAAVQPTRQIRRDRGGATAGGTVGYIAQAGELRELRRVGTARLRAVPVDARKPLLRPGVGVIADPVGGIPVAVADSVATGSGQTRIRRTLGGADMTGLGLPPPLPGLPAAGAQP